MGQVIVKADLSQISDIIYRWIADHGFTLLSNCSQTSEKAIITVQSRTYKALWNCASNNDGTVVSMDLSLRPYLSVMLHLAEIAGLLYAILTLKNVLKEFTLNNFLSFLAIAFFLIILLWWRTYRLSVCIDKTEKTFWDILGGSYDISQISKYEGHLIDRKYLLLKEASLAILAVVVCSQIYGATGFYSSLILCSGLLALITARHISNDNPQWHWRFWIIDNMFSWFTVILALIGLLIGLSAIEVITPLEGPDYSLSEILRSWHIRDISPASSNLLEADCHSILHATLQRQSEEIVSDQLFREFSLFYSISLMIMITGAAYFFSYRPLKSILKKSNNWKSSTSLPEETVIPNIPYFQGSEDSPIPISFYVAAGIFYIMGFIVNWFAAILCIDAFSYAFSGHAVFIEKTANLWSWIFVFCKVIFGNTGGYIAALSLITAIFMPILLVFACFLRRFLSNIILYIRFFFDRQEFNNDKIVHLNEFSKTMCAETVLTVNHKHGVCIHARSLFFGIKPIIELSRGAVDLLDFNELKAVIAHELGHIKSGIRKVEILKLLSSLGLFPNYYLTLCINWPKYETDADNFAIEVTRNPKALKTALIKISTAGLDFSERKLSNHSLGVKYHNVKRSISFFFGEGLLGYTHPHLSHRLAAIDSYNTKEVKL